MSQDEREIPSLKNPVSDGRRRVGTFRISERDLMLKLQSVRVLMYNVIVVRAEFHFGGGGIEYTAFCDSFEVVPPDCVPTRYEVKCHEDGTLYFAKAFGN